MSHHDTRSPNRILRAQKASTPRKRDTDKPPVGMVRAMESRKPGVRAVLVELVAGRTYAHIAAKTRELDSRNGITISQVSKLFSRKRTASKGTADLLARVLNEGHPRDKQINGGELLNLLAA